MTSPIRQPRSTSATLWRPCSTPVRLECCVRPDATTMAAVIGACRHIVGMRTRYVDTRTVTASANGSFHSLDPPTTSKNRPTPQPTSTLMMRAEHPRRLLHLRVGSRDHRCDAQIGFVSTMSRSTYHNIVDPMNTLTANRTPVISCGNNRGQFITSSRRPTRDAHSWLCGAFPLRR